jgi:hypothetical protein
MALRTAKKSTPYIIGTNILSSTLTADYSDNAVSFPTEMYRGMKLYVSYTPAANTRVMSIQVEYSPDGSDWYVESLEAQASTGVGNLLENTQTIEGAALATEYKRAYRVPIDSRFVRVSVKEDGGAPFGAVTIQGDFKI